MTAGLLIAFVAAPLVQAKTAELAPVVILTQDAPVGTRLTGDMLRVEEIKRCRHSRRSAHRAGFWDGLNFFPHFTQSAGKTNLGRAETARKA